MLKNINLTIILQVAFQEYFSYCAQPLLESQHQLLSLKPHFIILFQFFIFLSHPFSFFFLLYFALNALSVPDSLISSREHCLFHPLTCYHLWKVMKILYFSFLTVTVMFFESIFSFLICTESWKFFFFELINDLFIGHCI